MARSKIADKNKKDTLCLDGLKGVGAFIIAFMWHYQHFTSTTEVPLSRYFPLFF